MISLNYCGNFRRKTKNIKSLTNHIGGLPINRYRLYTVTKKPHLRSLLQAAPEMAGIIVSTVFSNTVFFHFVPAYFNATRERRSFIFNF